MKSTVLNILGHFTSISLSVIFHFWPISWHLQPFLVSDLPFYTVFWQFLGISLSLICKCVWLFDYSARSDSSISVTVLICLVFGLLSTCFGWETACTIFCITWHCCSCMWINHTVIFHVLSVLSNAVFDVVGWCFTAGFGIGLILALLYLVFKLSYYTL